MPKGHKTLSDEWCRAIGNGLKGNTNGKGKRSAEACRNIALGHTGLKDTDATKRAKSLAQKGIPKSPDAVKNMTAARRKRASEERLRIRLPKSRSRLRRPVWCVMVYSDCEPRFVRMMPLHEAEHPLAPLYNESWLHYLVMDNWTPRVECVFVGNRNQCKLRVEELSQQYESSLY